MITDQTSQSALADTNPALIPRSLSKSSFAGREWTAASFIVLNHIIACYILYTEPLPTWHVIGVMMAHAWLALLGITAGYHRLWSHRSYAASLPLRIFLACCGISSFQGSIRWWVLRHRLHHRFTDTPLDPYDSTRGFWYSHIMWLMYKPPRWEAMKYIQAKDLDSDPVVYYQKKFLLIGYIIIGLLSPALVGYWLCNSIWTGIMWFGVISRCVSWHCIFSINSFSHWMGEKEYITSSSAVWVPFIEFFQNGEGHHNYHHEFPQDYRHGIRWYHWDPTKWCINIWYYMGLVHSLRITREDIMIRSRYQVIKEIWKSWKYLKKHVQDLPVMTYAEYQTKVQQENLQWIMIDSLIYDVSTFSTHPGGIELFRIHYGRDATKLFNSLNNHTRAAQNLAQTMLVAKIEG